MRKTHCCRAISTMPRCKNGTTLLLETTRGRFSPDRCSRPQRRGCGTRSKTMSTKNSDYGWTSAEWRTATSPVNQLEIYYQARQMQAQAVRELAGKVGQFFAKIFSPVINAVREGHERRQIFWELSSLDDRTLADIGITRADIPRVSAGMWTPERRPAKGVVANPAVVQAI